MMTEQEGILLSALDGSNPLAFLAALGAFRLLTLESPESGIQMRWERADGAWRPRLRGIQTNEGELCRILHAPSHWAPAYEFNASLGKNLTVPKEIFKAFVKGSEKSDDAASMLVDRRAADFAASFGRKARTGSNTPISASSPALAIRIFSEPFPRWHAA